VPARRCELTGVAGALITCSELDPLRDEAVDYALRLMRAGVATEWSCMSFRAPVTASTHWPPLGR